MSTTGSLPPPPPPPPPSTSPGNRASQPSLDPRPPALEPTARRPLSRRLRAGAGATAAVVVAVAAAGGILAFRALHGSGDTLVALVPADAAFYVNVNFDPPAGQKLALGSLIGRFPALREQSRGTVKGWLDSAFSGSGLNWASDISPWVGSNMSLEVPASALSGLTTTSGLGSSSAPDEAVLIASKDDGKAQAALDKYRNGPRGRGDGWTPSTHGGVTVTAGSTVAYAIVNHAVVFAGNAKVIDAVIDTAQGKRANLQSASNYATVEAQLAGDRLGFAYIDVAAVVHAVGSTAGGSSSAQSQLDSLRAYRGAGVALMATSDGIMLAGTEDYDVTKLTPDQRASLAVPRHPNGSLSFVPSTAYGLIAYTGLRQMLHSVIATVAPAGSNLASTLEQYGVTGSSGILDHLTGDAGIEVDHLRGHTTPAGAAMFNTDSSSLAQGFLDNLVSSLCSQSTTCDASQITTQTDQGVTISSIPLSGGADSGVAPSWAVKDGWAIVGSSPEEVRAALDSRASGASITTSPTYAAVTSHVGSSNNGMFYVDVAAVANAVRGVLPHREQASYDRDVAPWLSPIRGMEMSFQNGSDHSTFSLFVLIG